MASLASNSISSFQVPIAGTDSSATFYQLLSVLSLHYLTLAIFVPPFLSGLARSPPALKFEGGPAQVGMILDWRELGSRKTFDWSPLGEDWLSWRKGVDKERLISGLDEGDQTAAKKWTMGSVWLGDVQGEGQGFAIAPSPPYVLDQSRIIRPGQEKQPQLQQSLPSDGQQLDTAAQAELEADLKAELADVVGSAGTETESSLEKWEWRATRDPSRGWAIAAAWMVACSVDVFLLTTVVRRPKHILDHVVTLHLVHLLLTSWYSSSVPTSLFWWAVMVAHATVCVLWAEREAIGREMKTNVGYGLVGSGRDAEPLHGSGSAQNHGSSNRSVAGPTHVLFDGDEEALADSVQPGRDGAASKYDSDGEDEDDERSKMIRKPTMGASFLGGARNGGRGGNAARNGAFDSHGAEQIPMKTLRKE